MLLDRFVPTNITFSFLNIAPYILIELNVQIYLMNKKALQYQFINLTYHISYKFNSQQQRIVNKNV